MDWSVTVDLETVFLDSESVADWIEVDFSDSMSPAHMTLVPEVDPCQVEDVSEDWRAMDQVIDHNLF